MELASVKIIVLTVSGVLRIFFGLFPLIIFRGILRGSEKAKLIKKIISYLMFFGGGVLLATCLVHMMPEVREKFQEAKLETDLPIADIVFISGFFLIYLLEDVIHGCIERRRVRRKIAKAEAAGISNHGFTYSVTPPLSATPVSPKELFGHHLTSKRNSEIPGLTPSIPRVRADNHKLNGSVSSIADAKFTYVDSDWWRESVNGNSQVNLVNSNPNLNVRSTSLYDIPLNGGINTPSKMNNHFSNSTATTNGWAPNMGEDDNHNNHGHSGHSHMHLPSSDEDDSVAGAFRNLLIVIAMSFHGIFEGLAIGLQGTEKNVIQLAVAVALHECTILFCIGVELISSKTKIVRLMTYILVVSLVCPIGIAIGIVVSESSFDGNSMEHALVVGSLTGLAAGTLLYVTFFEIFAVEGRHLKNKYVHILVAVAGFVLMVLFELIGGHSHGGGHGHSHSIHHDEIRNSSIVDDHDHHDHNHDPDLSHIPDGHRHDEHDHAGHGHGHSHSH